MGGADNSPIIKIILTMSNCNLNGQTFLTSLTPVGGGSENSSIYMVDLLHYTCCNRKICINGAFPLTSSLSAKLLGAPEDIGNMLYDAAILISGTVTYMPHRCGNGYNHCNCNQCPITDNVWVVVHVPVVGVEDMVLEVGEPVAVTPANVKDCCNVTNAVSLVASLIVKSAAPKSGKVKEK